MKRSAEILAPRDSIHTDVRPPQRYPLRASSTTVVPRRNFTPRESQKDTFTHKPAETPHEAQRTLGNASVFVPPNGHHVSIVGMMEMKPATGPDGTHGVRITPIVREPLTTTFGPSLGGGRSAEARHRAKAKARHNSHRR